jgi:hypothetical protein
MKHEGPGTSRPPPDGRYRITPTVAKVCLGAAPDPAIQERTFGHTRPATVPPSPITSAVWSRANAPTRWTVSDHSDRRSWTLHSKADRFPSTGYRQGCLGGFAALHVGRPAWARERRLWDIGRTRSSNCDIREWPTANCHSARHRCAGTKGRMTDHSVTAQLPDCDGQGKAICDGISEWTSRPSTAMQWATGNGIGVYLRRQSSDGRCHESRGRKAAANATSRMPGRYSSD